MILCKYYDKTIFIVVKSHSLKAFGNDEHIKRFKTIVTSAYRDSHYGNKFSVNDHMHLNNASEILSM